MNRVKETVRHYMYKLPATLFRGPRSDHADWIEAIFREFSIPWKPEDKILTSLDVTKSKDGSDYKKAVQELTYTKNLPIVYVDGLNIGGYFETLKAAKDGTLAKYIKRTGKDYREPDEDCWIWNEPNADGKVENFPY